VGGPVVSHATKPGEDRCKELPWGGKLPVEAEKDISKVVVCDCHPHGQESINKLIKANSGDFRGLVK
jgi:hypothetical protein